MIISLNEVENNVRDAAIGAGAKLGLAQDAGLSARRLASLKLPWCKVFLRSLRRFDFEKSGQIFSSRHLMCGPLISETFMDLYKVAILRMDTPYEVFAPLFIVPSFFSSQTDCSLEILPRDRDYKLIAISGRIITLGADNKYTMSDSSDAKILDVEESVVVLRGYNGRGREQPKPLREHTKNSSNIHRKGFEISKFDWEDLIGFVKKTHVKGSKYSRFSGAGAGLTDND